MEEKLVKSLNKTSSLWSSFIWFTYVERKQIFENFMIGMPNKTEKLFWHNYTVKAFNFISLEYYDLVTIRFIHEERLDVCDHHITQIRKFVKNMYEMKYSNVTLEVFAQLICNTKDSQNITTLIVFLKCLVCKIYMVFKYVK